jgi:hypothetical protein
MQPDPTDSNGVSPTVAASYKMSNFSPWVPGYHHIGNP